MYCLKYLSKELMNWLRYDLYRREKWEKSRGGAIKIIQAKRHSEQRKIIFLHDFLTLKQLARARAMQLHFGSKISKSQSYTRLLQLHIELISLQVYQCPLDILEKD